METNENIAEPHQLSPVFYTDGKRRRLNTPSPSEDESLAPLPHEECVVEDAVYLTAEGFESTRRSQDLSFGTDPRYSWTPNVAVLNLINNRSLPALEDGRLAVATKLMLLTGDAEMGFSIASKTNFCAPSITSEDSLCQAIAEFTPAERYSWFIYDSGTFMLPWLDLEPAFPSWQPQRTLTARDTYTIPLIPATDDETPPAGGEIFRYLRIEAINYLYLSENAQDRHVTRFELHQPHLLPLLDATIRVIRKEKDKKAGKQFLTADEFADLQTINDVLSVVIRVFGGNVPSVTGLLPSVEARAAAKVLCQERNRLRAFIDQGLTDERVLDQRMRGEDTSPTRLNIRRRPGVT